MITITPWRTIERRVEFSGGPIREIAKETVLLPDGRVISDFYTALMGDYALVYAVTVEGTVLMLRRFKHGVRRVCLTFPGGYVAPGEDPAVAAERGPSGGDRVSRFPRHSAGIVRDQRQPGLQHGASVSYRWLP